MLWHPFIHPFIICSSVFILLVTRKTKRLFDRVCANGQKFTDCKKSERKSKIKHSHSSQRLHISARWSSRKKQPCKTLWNWPWRTQRKVCQETRGQHFWTVKYKGSPAQRQERKHKNCTLSRETHRFWLGKTPQGLDRLRYEGEGSRSSGVLRAGKGD